MEFKNTELVDPKKLKINEDKLTILGRCQNYNEIYESIKNEGVLTPLLVNDSGFIISGNMRLNVAIELGLDVIPVTYVNVNESDIITILNTDINREKTLVEKLKIYFIIREKYKVPRGSRTDLNDELKTVKGKFYELNPLSEHELKSINKMLKISPPLEIINSVRKIEESGKVVKMPDVFKQLGVKKSNVKIEKIHYSEVFDWLSEKFYLSDTIHMLKKEFEDDKTNVMSDTFN